MIDTSMFILCLYVLNQSSNVIKLKYFAKKNPAELVLYRGYLPRGNELYKASI